MTIGLSFSLKDIGSLLLSRRTAGAYPVDGMYVLLMKKNARNNAYKAQRKKNALIIRRNYLPQP
jgi:hypothetical protein